MLMTDLTVTGLPSELAKPVCPLGMICGYPIGTYHGLLTKPGKFKVTVAVKLQSGRTLKCVHTLIVQDGGSHWLNVESPETWRGTVTGAKVYAMGSKASISAKAAKGQFFAGWYLDSDFTNSAQYLIPNDGWQNTNVSVPVSEDVVESGLYARFVSKGEDVISIDCDSLWKVDGNYDDHFLLGISSTTKPTISFKGLPSGIRFVTDGYRPRLYSESSKLKPGLYKVTIMVKNAAGNSLSKDIYIQVPNLESHVFSGLEYSTPYHLYVGVSDACLPGWVDCDYDSSWTVTANGLPPGLNFHTYSAYGRLISTRKLQLPHTAFQ